MGVSVNPKVIIGVNVSEIVSIDTKTETFDEFDRKGQKTGKTFSESVRKLKATINGQEVISDEEVDGEVRAYEIADFLKLTEYPSKGGFGVFDTDYDSDGIDTAIIGIMLLSCDAMCIGEHTDETDMINFNDVISTVKREIVYRFGKEIQPKIYLIGGCSY